MSENNSNTKKETKKKSKKGIKILGGIVAAVLVIFIIFAASVSAYDKMPKNTFVSGFDISGLTVDETEALISEKSADLFADKTVKLMYNGEMTELSVAELEPAVDAKQTAERIAAERIDSNIFAKAVGIITSSFKRHDDVLTVTLNDEKLGAKIDEFAVNFEKPAKECSFELSGNILKINKGEDGTEFNHDTVKNDVYNAVSSLKFNDVDLRMENVKPKEVSLDEFYEKISAPAVNAYYEKADGQVTVNPGTPHIVVDKAKVDEALKSGDAVSEIEVGIEEPSVTKSYLEGKIFIHKMGSHTSRFSTSNYGRSSNVRLAASKINNYILLPGEVFSYDNTVGPRTAANGFKEAGVYIGNKVEQGIGGGICQVSSTLYSAVLYANLEIVERTSHSLPVSYMPDGQDATIAQGYLDFKFRNNTDYPVKIVTYTNGGSLTCDIYGVKQDGLSVRVVHSRTGTLPTYKTRESDPSIPVGYMKISQKGADGYKVASTRIVSVNGVETNREQLTSSVYNASPTIELVNPADMNTPSESLKVYSGATPPPEQTQAPSAAENTEQTLSTDGQTTAENTSVESGADNSEPTSAENTATEVESVATTEVESINID